MPFFLSDFFKSDNYTEYSAETTLSYCVFYFTDKFVLKGTNENTNYAIVSAVQVEHGPRLFYPHFGFFYKAKNTRVKVKFVEKASGTKHDIMTVLENPLNNNIERDLEWKYFSQNLSDVSFLTAAWNGNTKIEWQV